MPIRAVIVKTAGNPLRLVEVDRPEPGVGELLVRVAGSAVNPLDMKILAGIADHAWQSLPAILGIDLGHGGRDRKQRHGFHAGDWVFSVAGRVGGACRIAGLMTVDAYLLACAPSKLTMREAAAVPLVFINAWEGLVDRVGLREDSTCSSTAPEESASALQIGRARGAILGATGSPAARGAIERLGAKFIEDECTGRHRGARDGGARLRRGVRHSRRRVARRRLPD